MATLFSRAAAALRSTVPFERTLLVIHDDAETTSAFAFASADGPAPAGRAGSRGDYSPRLWPDGDGAPVLIRDASTELDLQWAEDRRLLESGARAVLAAPLRVGNRSLGLAAFVSDRVGVFTAAHAASLEPALEVLALALERERVWALEESRHRRHAKLAALLPTIAGSLDVRRTFLGLAATIQDVVPHDILAFALLTPDRNGVRIQAATHAGMMEMPEYRYSNEEERLDSNWDFLIAHDLTPVSETEVRVRVSPRDAPLEHIVARPGPAWTQFVARAGVHSSMRIPIRAHDRPLGGIVFLSRRTDAYDEEDAVLGARIADHVALALAHQDLAEEERRIAQAEARAQLLEAQVDNLSRELQRFSAHRALGQSAAWKQALADATRVARTETTVLITGESGTGKEVLARFIHRGSPRAQAPFAAMNCAALPMELLESELFGHERGAFTGAVAARAGKIEQAAGGILFLDEVGEMSPAVQAKFLRVLQEREFQRLGGTRTLKADVRIIAATNRDPRRAVETGLLREDLYYRLSVFEIHLPPLRERPDDILLLAQAFVEEFAAGIGRPAPGLSEDACELLMAHEWPGNVRELRNAIERALILCHGGLITREHLPVTVVPRPAETIAAAAPETPSFPLGGMRLEAIEKDLVEKALAQARGNKSEAAKLLGLPRGRLYSLMRRYGLTQARR